MPGQTLLVFAHVHARIRYGERPYDDEAIRMPLLRGRLDRRICGYHGNGAPAPNKNPLHCTQARSFRSPFVVNESQVRSPRKTSRSCGQALARSQDDNGLDIFTSYSGRRTQGRNLGQAPRRITNASGKI